MTPLQGALLLAICLAWGFHMIVIKSTVDFIPPLTYVAVRMSLLAIILSPLLRWHKGQMLRIAIGGACFGGLNYAFMFNGFKFTTASIGAVLTETYVIIATLFSIFFLGERVGWKRTAGIAAAMLGVGVIATAEGELAGSRNVQLGAFLIVTAATFEATGALFVKKIEGVKPLAMLAWFAVVGAAITIVLAAIIDQDHFAWVQGESRTAIILALIYSILIASIFGHASYYYLLQRAPLSLIAPSGLLITFFAVLFGVVLLGEALTPRLLIGAGMVVSGVAVVLLRSHAPDRKQVLASAAANASEASLATEETKA